MRHLTLFPISLPGPLAPGRQTVSRTGYIDFCVVFSASSTRPYNDDSLHGNKCTHYIGIEIPIVHREAVSIEVVPVSKLSAEYFLNSIEVVPTSVCPDS